MSWNLGSGQKPPDNFISMLVDSEEESEEEDVEMDRIDLHEADLDEETNEIDEPNDEIGEFEDALEFELLDQPLDMAAEVEFRSASDENRTPINLIGIYNESGEMVSSPLAPSYSPWPPASPSRQLVTPTYSTPPGSPAAPQSRSPVPLGSPDSSQSQRVNDVVVVVERMSSESSLTHEPQRGRGRARGAFAGRGRARGGRGGRRANRTRTEWSRGDRLVEIYLDDDDVPEDLRDKIMRIAEAREARGRRQRRRRDEEEEEEGGDEALFNGDEAALHFQWEPMRNFDGHREEFLPETSGPTTPPESAYGAFRQFWDDNILSHIVIETNRYGAGLAASVGAFGRRWYETNADELMILFSFWMMLGIVRMPSIKSCFANHPLLKTNIFRAMFSQKRYEDLCRALHFADNSARTAESSRLYPIEHIVSHLNEKFKQAYIPRQEICIDESLTLWKGQLSFRQYIKTKTARFGIKTFELCESATGYLWSFFVYTGKDHTRDERFPSSLLVSTKSVLKLIWPLLDKGYTLFMDNWFNCPLLARFLKSRKTDCVGTLRSNRRNVPLLVTHCQLEPGQYVARHSGDTMVMAYQDKKKIPMISTYHGIDQAMTEPKPHLPAQWKPKVILDYNKSMGGVDRKDQQLEPYLLERKRCSKWTMKLFKRLLNVSILNSRILVQQSTDDPVRHLAFRLELVQQIHAHHLLEVPRPHRLTSQASRADLPENRRVANTHWLRTSVTRAVAGRLKRRRCIWCSKRNQKECRTLYECETCEVPLCLEPCFKLFHTSN